MTTLNIEGHKVKVSDDFLSLSPEEQERTVEEIAGSLVLENAPEHRLTSQMNAGIANGVGGLVDLLNPFDEPHALNPFPEGTGSAKAGITSLMEAGGIEVAEDTPEGLAENFMRGSGEAAAALIPVTKGLQVLSKGGGALGQFADDAYRSLATLMGSSADVMAGGMSRSAEALAEEAGAPEWVQDTAAIAAPMSIPAAGMAAKGVVKASPIAAVSRRIAAEAAPYTKKGAKAVAAKRVQDLAGGRDRADELATRINKDNPLGLTPAQQTDDPNMLALEKLAASQDPKLREELAGRALQSAKTAKGELSSMGGDVQKAQAWFEGRRRAFTAQLRQQADDIVASSEKRLRGLSGQQDESQNSLTVYNRIRTKLDDALKREKAFWDAIPSEEPIGTIAAKAKAQSLVDKTPYAQRNDIPRAVRDLLDNADVYGDGATVREMHGLYSELRRVARSAMAGTDQNKNMARIANEVADAVLEDLGAKAATTEVGRKINAARAFSSALHETFDQGAVGRILKRTVDGDMAIDPELALKRTVGRGGVEAAVASRQIEEAAGDLASKRIQDYIADLFNRSAVSSGSGEVSLKGARSFMAKNRELLTRYPELKGEIEAAVRQHETAEQIAGRISRRIAALEDARRSAVARFIDAPTDKAVKSILDAKNPAKAARTIANAARRDSSGQALDGVKAALSDHLIGTSLRTSGANTTLDANALNRALSDGRMKTALKQVFSEAEISRLHLIAKELTKAQTTNAADIGPSLSAGKANRLIEMVVRIGAANKGAELGGGSGGSIQTAAMASNRAKDLLNHLATDKASQMLADAVTDPDLFRALLQTGVSPKAEARSIPYFIPYLVGGASTAASEER
ncbi:hypothetical protein [Shimia aestuarii]|uniref:hypothetical protein n=1 Tax=Shimia aestuarii TaxID=254406 RepID=UPI001FB4A390|nr:hypothetical protein [Shimia aestuarii]